MLLSESKLLYISYYKTLDYPSISDEENIVPKQCNWIKNATNECILKFSCNPAAEIFKIIKGFIQKIKLTRLY